MRGKHGTRSFRQGATAGRRWWRTLGQLQPSQHDAFADLETALQADEGSARESDVAAEGAPDLIGVGSESESTWRPFAEGKAELEFLQQAMLEADGFQYLGKPTAAHCLSKIKRHERTAAWHLTAAIGLHVVVLVAGIASPLLLGINLALETSLSKWVALGFAVIAALGLGLQEGFDFYDRWRWNRKLAEALKREAWAFANTTGEYRGRAPRSAAMIFSERFGELNQVHTEEYLDQLSLPEGARNALAREPKPWTKARR
jgi:hypothetical protein